jgi:small subunit ribosomal protein S19
MAKEFTFRGKTLKELEAMSLEDFAQLCTSRARRSLRHGLDKPFLKRLNKAIEVRKSGKYPKPVRTHKRDLVVVPQMLGIPIGIYKGNGFEVVEIKQEMLGHFLGELALTRKKVSHGKAGIGATRSSTAISARK